MLLKKNKIFSLLILIFCITPTCTAKEVKMINNEQIEKSHSDSNIYKYLQLENGIKVVLVENPKSEKSAAALSVNIGSYQNPKESLGLAHFLEHMLFLGTKKYPVAGEYQNFISDNGGYTNAFTASEITTYLFQVQPEYFDEAIDRFSQFFISPLFTEELVSREINAVDSEYKLRINNDDWRNWNLLKTISNSDHPFSQFATGNIETLNRHSIKDLRLKMVEFYEEYYKPEFMTLSIEGPQKISELANIANKYFNTIKKSVNIQSNPNKTYTSLIYTSSNLKNDVYIKPFGDRKTLTLNFPIDNQRKNYENKPTSFISYLINSKHYGGLYYYLSKNNYITDQSADNLDLTITQDLFYIDFDLTDKGLENIDHITEKTLSYLNWLNNTDIPSWIFEELKQSNIRSFQFKQPVPSIDNVVNITSNLHIYPPENILNNSYLTQKSILNSNSLKNILNKLTVDNMFRLITNKNTDTDKIEKYYGVEYKINPISKDSIKKWHNLTNDNLNQTIAWKLPTKNTYMPNDFNIKIPEIITENNDYKYPIRKNNNFFYKQDTKFSLPLTTITIFIKNNIVNESVKNKLSNSLFVDLLNDNLKTESTKLNLAGASIYYHKTYNGIYVSIYGYNDKIETVIELAIDKLLTYKVDPNKFNDFKYLKRMDLSNYKQQTLYSLGIAETNYLLYPESVHPKNLLEQLETITTIDLSKFQNDLLSNFKLENIIYGNIDPKQYSNIEHIISNTIKKPYNSKVTPLGYKKIQPGSTYVWFVDADNKKDSVLITTYQSGTSSLNSRAKIALLRQIIDPHVYKTLRTDEQLGYVVGCFPNVRLNNVGLTFIIESPNNKSYYLLSRLENFITSFNTQLSELGAEDFHKQKQVLIKNLLEEPKSFSEQFQEYNIKIIDGSYAFDDVEKISKLVNKITKEELLNFYHELLENSKTIRRLIVASPDPDFADQNYMVITDLDKFKKS